MVRVLVTGATSLLARRTAEALLARGDEVVCLQRHRAELDTVVDRDSANVTDNTASVGDGAFAELFERGPGCSNSVIDVVE